MFSKHLSIKHSKSSSGFFSPIDTKILSARMFFKKVVTSYTKLLLIIQHEF